MGKLFTHIRPTYDQANLSLFFQDVTRQVNSLSEGRLSSHYNAMSSAPVGEGYAKGDIVYNSNPSEEGAEGSKYIIIGWMCTDSQTPTFKELRIPTGG